MSHGEARQYLDNSRVILLVQMVHFWWNGEMVVKMLDISSNGKRIKGPRVPQ
jgi:hypothetical protein